MKYFTISELTKSDTASASGINNAPDSVQESNLIRLVENVLDPLREAWGKPIKVNSGFRCPALNKAVKGSSTSDHMKGMAADIDTGNRQQNKLLFDIIQKKLPFTQLIWEQGGAWIHVSYDKNNLKKQVLSL